MLIINVCKSNHKLAMCRYECTHGIHTVYYAYELTEMIAIKILSMPIASAT